MNIFLQILLGLAIIGLGILMVYKTQWFMSLMGRLPFAERYLGGGGTRTFYKLLGIVICLLGLVVATGTFDDIVGGFIMRLFNR